MTDLLAILFRVREYVIEYVPFFLAAWFGLAVTTGLITAWYRKRPARRVPENPSLIRKSFSRLGQLCLFMFRHPGDKAADAAPASTVFLFSLAASIPALAVTYLISSGTVWLRLALAAVFVIVLYRIFVLLIGGGEKLQGGLKAEAGPLPGTEETAVSPPASGEPEPTLIRVIWKSFEGQINRYVVPLLVGFGLASAIAIYFPVYTLRPWVGASAWWAPFLAALLVIPFQLSGGTEVPTASVLLIKGAGLGTALSVMLVAPVTVVSVVRRFRRTGDAKSMVVYLAIAWLAAGSLGLIINGLQRLIG